MIKINQSSIAGTSNFSALVYAFAKELSDWTAHMARVEDDKRNNVAENMRHIPFPRPVSSPMIEAAINENLEPDFEIVDDGPTPEQKLAAKKKTLLDEVSEAEEAAVAAISPPGKRRFLTIRDNEIGAKRVAISNRLLAEGKAPSSQPDMENAINDCLSPDDQTFLKRSEEIKRKTDAIARAAALMQHDIEDLTEANIDAWQMTPFQV
jgi:hypothetical protein